MQKIKLTKGFFIRLAVVLIIFILGIIFILIKKNIIFKNSDLLGGYEKVEANEEIKTTDNNLSQGEIYFEVTDDDGEENISALNDENDSNKEVASENKENKQSINSFEECKKAGYPVTVEDSVPECWAGEKGFYQENSR